MMGCVIIIGFPRTFLRLPLGLKKKKKKKKRRRRRRKTERKKERKKERIKEKVWRVGPWGDVVKSGGQV